MFKPQDTMIVFFFLGLPFLSRSDIILPEKTKGDYPDANKVMKKLPQTYMLQSLGYYANLTCGYQEFYSHTKRNKTFRMFDFFSFYMDGRFFHQAYYVKNVTNYIIFLGTHRRPSLPATAQRDILFSDMKSCMVIKNPKNPQVKNNGEKCVSAPSVALYHKKEAFLRGAKVPGQG
uniref:Putative secreted protein n=1 Tax=Ixodes ricinus TaxID=34613 RepID=A0A090XD09_IXORI